MVDIPNMEVVRSGHAKVSKPSGAGLLLSSVPLTRGQAG